jgi:hypothetical protein
MRIHKAGHEICSIEDWFKWAPPKMGARHWKDGRSAKELARSWLLNGNVSAPAELTILLERTFGVPIIFDEGMPECVIPLDDFVGEQRNCDLVLMCSARGRRMVVNIEAKADEPFGDCFVGSYYDEKFCSRSNVPARIRSLSLALFGRLPDEVIRSLRYQLLHAAAATLIEAATNDAEIALFLVHEFRSKALSVEKLKTNKKDWKCFIRVFPELTTATLEKGEILGPVSVPGADRVPHNIPLYLGKLATVFD